MGDAHGKNEGTSGDIGDISTRPDRYRITSSKRLKLSDCNPGDIYPAGLEEKEAVRLLGQRIKRLSVLQEKLFISKAAAILVVLQAMDGGRHSTIKHVTAGIHPQGLTVTSFKAPSPEENAHDFLWRVSNKLPALGMIGVFNRSHYEFVLIARVHPEILAQEGLPRISGISRDFGTIASRISPISNAISRAKAPASSRYSSTSV